MKALRDAQGLRVCG